MSRAVVRLLTVFALVATALALPGAGTTPASTAQAADLRYFDAGNIISDAVFFDGLAMDRGAVQTFLSTKGAACVAGEMPCLKDYRQNTADQSGDAYCSTYRGAANETAASILVKIGAACRVNPRVLLVLLQKEQGLVTGTRPSATRYTKATGFACPDTSACNPAFSGFVSQVYFAARQFQRYAAGVAGSYRAGRDNKVHYHPDLTRCGSSMVYISNKATAGLYSYTPYQPNAAALAAGYREGDSCSSYGNRNFWNYFTDWFGSTQSQGGGAIYLRYQEAGGADGPLGAPATTFVCGLTGGGCFQQFARGAIYWSPRTGAHVVTDSIRHRWGLLRWETGTLGYPTSDTWCGLAGGACFQQFQGGSLYATSPTATAYLVRGGIRDRWAAEGYENGTLGFPTSDENCGLPGGGCFSEFQKGSIYWSPRTEAQVVLPDIRTGWATVGYEGGALGYPTNSTRCGLAESGCFQRFQGGMVHHTPATGSQVTRGVFRTRWSDLGSANGILGYPTDAEYCGLRSGGCFQTFENGSLYRSSSTGPHAVTGEVLEGWAARRYEAGPLGYPVGDTYCGLTGGGCFQPFQGGYLYWTADTGAHLVRGGIFERWGAHGWEGGRLGYPTSDEYCGLARGGCFETFTGGSIYYTPATGAHSVSGVIMDAWASQGYETGRWGYPKSEPRKTATGLAQVFTGGTATYTAATGEVTFR
ncbi:hypothetical protein GCM10023328_29870 [Modestobacter marinus]|uniref:Uncharacterized protein with LGFP repeats n=1 Tax=Modestobacter marinus TaxID=477641 RepID=A0A846LK22_9ACTN|nr:hypothetical protein [Modestobacter marinus]NIH67681.1 uncharacterized protein with LGFP repeats [Modestobacter marinus]GGL72142.1 hypothetical protein GCM10011589_30590 [Modestobacter marinus]